MTTAMPRITTHIINLDYGGAWQDFLFCLHQVFVEACNDGFQQNGRRDSFLRQSPGCCTRPSDSCKL